MIRVSASTLLLLFAVPTFAQDGEEDLGILTSIVLRSSELSHRELESANRYAQCVSLPYFPLADKLPERTRDCREQLPKRASETLLEMADWVDKTAGEHPGSEASLRIARPEK